MPTEEIISPDLARHLTEISREIGRQVGILLDRKGNVERVMVGDAHQIELPDVGRARAGQVRLRGLRLVHTHLGSDPVDRDDLTDLALLRLDLVAAIHARDDGLPGLTSWAHLLPENEGEKLWRVEEARDIHEAVAWPALTSITDIEEQFAARARRERTAFGRERAILVGLSSINRFETEARMAELAELASTAGVDVVDSVVQSRRKPDPRYLVGRGKIADINLRAMQRMVEVIIFDQDLAPSQARAIAEVTSVKIIDRTQLILDIFAQRAQSNEGKIQVELAQLRYTMPRLQARDDSLSRLTGGIGARGPGETKLEVDRRRVRDRISRLERDLKAISTSRQTRRRRRNRRGLPTISIIGYTNAGKSTLLNALTSSNVLVEDKLFATLDPTSRRLKFPRDREVLVTDTVGFIRDLPRDLKAAFKATLEELSDADLLLHVVDGSDRNQDAHVAAVEGILGELGLIETPRVLVYNKADKLSDKDEPGLQRKARGVRGGSANRGGKNESFQEKGSTTGTMVGGRGETALPPQEERDSAPDRCLGESTATQMPRCPNGRNETHPEALHPRQGIGGAQGSFAAQAPDGPPEPEVSGERGAMAGARGGSRAKNLAASNGGVAVSALTKEGFDDLLQRAGAMLFREGATAKVQMSLADLA